MAGQASGGQQLTPNRNVNAPAGHGFGIWGAFGGGAIAIGGGATDQTGFVKPVAATAADGETATNFIPSALPATASGLVPAVIGQESNAALLGTTQDSALNIGGSNAG